MTFIHFHHLSVNGDHGSIWRPWLTGQSRLWEVGEEGAGGGCWCCTSLWSRSSSEWWGEKIHKCCKSRLIFLIIRHIIRLNSASRTQILPSSSPSSILLLLLLSFYSCLEIRNKVAVYTPQPPKHTVKDGQFRDDHQYWSWLWRLLCSVWVLMGSMSFGGSGCWMLHGAMRPDRWHNLSSTSSSSAFPSVLSICHKHVFCFFFYISTLLWACLWIKSVRMCGSEMKWALFYSCWRVLIRTQ